MLSVALEVAFPQCAIIRLRDEEVEENEETLESLVDGKAYEGDWGDWGGELTMGSRAEGVAMEPEWGHPEPDTDHMNLYGGPMGVYVPQGGKPPGRSLLRFRPEGCPPAFCKIEVTNLRALKKLDAVTKGAEMVEKNCFVRSVSDGVDWLHIANTLRYLANHRDGISGPVGQEFDGLMEYAPTLICSAAHPDMKKYVCRPRQSWPSSQQLKGIQLLPMLIVLIGHKRSDEFPLQARLSWSPLEMKLVVTLSSDIRQVYIALKYVIKSLTKKFRGPNATTDGRSFVGSYHVKTVLLHHLERKPPTMIMSQLELMMGLLHDLDGYIVAGKLPHYFLPDCDLIETVRPEDRHITRNVIKDILADPLRAILTCPTDPQDIYGDIHPEILVDAFHRLSCHTNCTKNRKDLLQLLGRLDERRCCLYQQQLEKDQEDQMEVSGRPERKLLVDVLQKHMKLWQCTEE